jgi:hypothetical protein
VSQIDEATAVDVEEVDVVDVEEGMLKNLIVTRASLYVALVLEILLSFLLCARQVGRSVRLGNEVLNMRNLGRIKMGRMGWHMEFLFSPGHLLNFYSN